MKLVKLDFRFNVSIFLLFLIINILKSSIVFGQSGCPNSDFSMGNFTDWSGSTGINSAGDYSSIVNGIVQGTTNSGPFDPGQQTLINAPGTDPNTGNALNVLPPTGTSCCRLGNANYNAHAERLSYTLPVTASNCIFTYQYAVVLEDPSHTASDQPKFTIYVKNSAGNVVDPTCGIYEVTAAAGIPGFNTYTGGGTTVRWKDWTTVGIDLSAYISQNITIEFTTYDCAQGGHYGYAYIACTCGSMQLSQLCQGTSSVISAPAGFSTYSWSVGGTGQSVTINNPVNGTNVSCTCTSVQGCAVVLNALINISPVTFTTNSPSICPGGTAVLTASPGTYNYSWSNLQTGSSISVTPASTTTYSVTASDPGGGCSSSSQAIVTVFPLPTANAGNDVAICNGSSASLTASGGVSYQWSNSANTATTTVTPSTVTTYTVTVTSADGCTASDNVIVSFTVPVANAGTDQIICAGQSANLTAFGGVSYAWSNSSHTQSTNVSPAATALYTVTVTDASGCTATDDVQVTVNSLPSANAGPDQAICIGSSANLNASGGVTYSWNPTNALSDPNIANPIANPLNTVNYMVTVTDVNGCSASDNMILTVNPLPLASAGPDQTICTGQNANLMATGGTGYSWNPITALSNPNIANPVANPVTTSVYTVTVTDANGCSATDDLTINVNVIPTSTFTVTSPVCVGQSTSQIAYTGTGTLGAAYNWDFDGGTIVSGSGQGPYQVGWSTPATYNVSLTVTENSCTSPVTSLSAIVGHVTASLAITDSISCFGISDGQVTATPVGTSPYIYAWSDLQMTQIASNLSANTQYTVTVTDANGCTTSQSITLTQPAPLSMNFLTQNVSCYAGNNGIASAVISGGTTSYNYSWVPSTTAGNVNNVTTLHAGTYTLNVSDYHGCAIDTTFTISQPPQLTFTYTADSVNCFSGQDGSICIVPSGGSQPYGYIWSPNVSVSNCAYNLAAGNYTVNISDHNGCDTTALIVVGQPPQLIMNNSGNVTICNGQTTIISASATGGTGNYTFTWDNGLGIGSSFNVNPIVTTTYTVSITDANGCSATPQSLTVTVNPPISVNVTANPQSICLNETSTLVAIANGGNGNYTYTWGQGIGVSSQTVIVAPVVTTMYPVTVSDNCGSPVGIDSVEVIVYPLPTVQFSADTLNGCEPLTVHFTDNSTPAIATWVWNFGDPLSGANNTSTVQNPVHVFSQSGSYSITLTVTTTGGGCPGTYTHTNMIEVYPMPVADFFMHPSVGSTTEPLINFTDQSIDASHWDWNFGDPGSGLNDTSTDANPEHSFSTYGTFTVTLWVQSIHGCADSTSKEIFIKQDFSIYFPNAFTPNGDGDNEGWKPEGTGIDENNYQLYIYDRWGEMIFKTQDFNEYWNGKIMNSGQLCEIAVYSWLVYVKDVNGESYSYKGRVTLVR
jgi:gliding motility-associated-like protein